jgi:hypothetical protein
MARLGEEAEKVLKAGADVIHFDVVRNYEQSCAFFVGSLVQSLSLSLFFSCYSLAKTDGQPLCPESYNGSHDLISSQEAWYYPTY